MPPSRKLAEVKRKYADEKWHLKSYYCWYGKTRWRKYMRELRKKINRDWYQQIPF